jgi:cell division protein FtsN
MLKISLAVVLSAALLAGCVYERDEGGWTPDRGQGASSPPAPPPRTVPPRAQADVPPDRVHARDLAPLSPGSGSPGPDADVRRLPRTAAIHGRLFVQAASYATRRQAERARRALADLGPTTIYTAYVGDQLRYRVRVGPLATAGRSERVRAALIARGYDDAIILRD